MCKSHATTIWNQKPGDLNADLNREYMGTTLTKLVYAYGMVEENPIKSQILNINGLSYHAKIEYSTNNTK